MITIKKALPLLQVLLLATHCRGRCMQPPPITEQLQTAKDRGVLIARLTYTKNNTSIAPCTINDWSTGRSADIPLYTIQDIFLDSGSFNVSIGDQLPIILWTDTGYVRSLPSQLQEDSDGFLGELSLMANDSQCNYPLNDTWYETSYPIQMYVMSECNINYGNDGSGGVNRAWSSVSDEVRQQLSNLANPPTEAPASTTTSSIATSASPSKSPVGSVVPTEIPTLLPTTAFPTWSPSTKIPTFSPTTSQIEQPISPETTSQPINNAPVSTEPTKLQTTTASPFTSRPALLTDEPSSATSNSNSPTTAATSPSKSPVGSIVPTEIPTLLPTSAFPTWSPSTKIPTFSPTISSAASEPTRSPTDTIVTSEPTVLNEQPSSEADFSRKGYHLSIVGVHCLVLATILLT